MAKLGSKKNPLILRIADEARVDEIATICEENGWRFILSFEPDGEEDLSDLGRKLSPPTELRAMTVGRNDPCWCDSGKKYKKCCGVSS